MVAAHSLAQLVNRRMAMQRREAFVHIHAHDGKTAAIVLRHQNCPAALWRLTLAK